MAKEYRIVDLIASRRDNWEEALNEAADRGFEWVDSFSQGEGFTYAVMVREPPKAGARMRRV